ncbi:MAG: hypothetical protein ACREUA_01810 [Burkholderiales bacterium]
MHIVVIDAAHLPLGAEFPPLQAERYGWEEYREIDASMLAQRCRRAGVLVTVASVVSRQLMAQLPRLKLIAVAAAQVDGVDLEAAAKHGIAVCNVPPGSDPCTEVCANIDAFVRGERRNRVI